MNHSSEKLSFFEHELKKEEEKMVSCDRDDDDSFTLLTMMTIICKDCVGGPLLYERTVMPLPTRTYSILFQVVRRHACSYIRTNQRQQFKRIIFL